MGGHRTRAAANRLMHRRRRELRREEIADRCIGGERESFNNPAAGQKQRMHKRGKQSMANSLIKREIKPEIAKGAQAVAW